MKNNFPVFLDTSIQILRRMGLPKLKEIIENELEKQKHKGVIITSHYVRMEFARAFIGRMIYLYNQVRTLNIGKVLAKINTLPPVQARLRSISIDAIAVFFIGELENKSVPPISLEDATERMRLWLKDIIEDSWDWFNESVDGLIDETKCKKANSQPIAENGIYKSLGRCSKNKYECDIIDFFNRNKEQFKKIYDRLSSIKELDSQLEKLKNTLEKIFRHDFYISESKNCLACGDAIIAIECPIKGALFHFNPKHYKLLLSLLNKKEIDKSQEILSAKRLSIE